MTTPTMAEVLTAHTAWATTNPDGEWLITCVDCKAVIGTYDSIVPKEVGRNGGSYDLLDAALAAHQAAALSAAGFGPVKEAKAEALLTMADRLEKARDMTWNGSMRKVNGWASAADFLRQHSEQAGAVS